MSIIKFGKLIVIALCVGLIWTQCAQSVPNVNVLVLDGNGDYVRVDDSPNLSDGSNGLTGQAWVKVTVDSFPSMAIASKWEPPSNRSWAFLVTASEGTWPNKMGRLQLLLYRASGNLVVTYTTVDPVILTHTWQHVVVVFDPSQVAPTDKVKFYVNNVLKSHNLVSDPIDSLYDNDSYMYVGRFDADDLTTQYWHGYMDEFRMTSDVLVPGPDFPDNVTDPPFMENSDTEVLFHFNETITPLDPIVIDYATVFGNPDNVGTMMGSATRLPWNNLGPGQDIPLPVTAITLAAAGGDENAVITWTTETEYNNLGFHLYRSMNQQTGFSRINSELIPGTGSSVTTQHYSYLDTRDLINGVTYYYEISDVDVFGREKMHNIIASATPHSEVIVPGEDDALVGYQLSQNYPNPFNATTTIRYHVSNDGAVRLSIYDTSGREVTMLQNGIQESGEYYVQFDASSYPTGIYFARLTGSDNHTDIKKLLYLK